MQRILLSIVLGLNAAAVVAEDDERAPAAPARPAAPAAAAVVPNGAVPQGAAAASLPFAPAALATRPRGRPPETPQEVAAREAAAAGPSTPAAGGTGDGAATPAAFVAEDHWGLAGYNNDELFYTIRVTSHDARALHCTAILAGTFVENGQKTSVADRQTATVLPGEQTEIGNWQGMDRGSGATYSVKCRPL